MHHKAYAQSRRWQCLATCREKHAWSTADSFWQFTDAEPSFHFDFWLLHSGSVPNDDMLGFKPWQCFRWHAVALHKTVGDCLDDNSLTEPLANSSGAASTLSAREFHSLSGTRLQHVHPIYLFKWLCQDQRKVVVLCNSKWGYYSEYLTVWW